MHIEGKRNPRGPARYGSPRTLALSAIAFLGIATIAAAQGSPEVPTPGLTQSNVARFSLQEYPGTDVMVMEGSFEPAATPGRHRHPGPELVYVIEGQGLLLQDGRDPVELHKGMTVLSEPDIAGSSFTHEIRNTSPSEPLRTYVVLLLGPGEPPALPPQ